MYKGEERCVIDPIERIQVMEAENVALRSRIDELMKANEELKAVHEKQKCEIEWLRNECDVQQKNKCLLEAQMEVVRLIFGRRAYNG